MILGDALRELSCEGIAMLERVLDPLPEAAVPLDLFRHDSPPRRWRARTHEGWLMGYFNWDDVPCTTRIEPADWGGAHAPLVDVWTNRELAAEDLQPSLPPHHSRLVRVITSGGDSVR